MSTSDKAQKIETEQVHILCGRGAMEQPGVIRGRGQSASALSRCCFWSIIFALASAFGSSIMRAANARTETATGLARSCKHVFGDVQ